MENSTIYTKLLLFQTKVEAITKDGKNTFFKKPDGKASTYATLSKIISEIKPILSECKLVMIQPIINDEVLTIVIDSETKEQLSSGIKLNSGLNPQQMGSAITYYRRYTLGSLLSLEIDEDDDGNKASAPASKAPAKPLELTSEQKDNSTRLVLTTTVAELGAVWTALSKDEQKRTLALKDELKIKLTK